jgi:8-oxo-dGTP diphosphatase
MKEFGEKIKGVRYTKRPGSYGVAINDGRVAVIKSSVFGKYFLIGGAIEEGEDEREALRREALEEIGFEIETGERIGEAVEYFQSKDGGQYIVKECRFYRISILNKVKKKTEHKLIWINRDELGELYHESQRWIVDVELERINKI